MGKGHYLNMSSYLQIDMAQQSLMDLRPLQTFLIERNLKFEIGEEATVGNGDCFLNGTIQNLNYFAARGLWNKEIPSSSKELRLEVINYMKSNKMDYIRSGSHDEKNFEKLIESQRQNYAYTDEEGYFVRATAEFLDVEIVIVIPSIQTPVLDSGCGGPLQRINVGNGDKLRLCFGLLRDETRRTGHYQFIRAVEQTNTIGVETTG